MKNTYSVGQVNRYIKNMFTQDYLLQKIYVKGEVSNCKYHTSGHIYFSLKDETGTLNCVMFAGHRRGLAFAMKNGDKVIVGGSVDVYERDGRYQMYAKEITLEGAGTLYERYLALKQELEDMGMFAQEYKQPIPRFIRRLGVVTAPTGAAVQDIRNISYRRNPYLQIILYPALVQGAGAAESIVKGIQMLDKTDVDVIIVGRGGGSIEDLWAFNEEIVARAIFECSTPIISAVGHETDFTIADFVADLRAPTPSAAAELAICAAMKNSGRPFAPSDYAYKESGQPTIQNGHISISHTEGYAACAISRQPVGIDVERERTFSKAAAKRILSPQEELMSDSTNADELLSRIWTVKESFLKMTGEGIPGGMRTLELIAAGDGSSDVWTIKRGTELEAGCAVLLSISGSGNSADFNDAYLSVCTKKKAMMHINRFESVESILEFLNEP